jgi:Zn-finger nucleic acid-binding protein
VTVPVNDVLGLFRKGRRQEAPFVERATNLDDLVERYEPMKFPRGALSDAYNRAVYEDFLAAAEDAAKGRLSSRIATYLERLRFDSDGGVSNVPDFTALAAWSLLEALRRQPLQLRTCPNCKGKWLAPPSEVSRYCQRRAPGQVSRDCRTLDYEKRLAGTAYHAYRKEYKRVAELQRRGTIDLAERNLWREHNTPASWLPYDQWKED